MPLLILVAKYLNLVAAVVLSFRLVSLGLFNKYKAFAIFLLYELSVSLAFVAVPWHEFYDRYGIDYRIIWLAERPIAWVLYVGVVYSILNKVMQAHPAILNASKKALAASFAVAIAIGFVSAEMEFSVTNERAAPALVSLVTHGVVIERACLTTAFLLLALTFSFLLWFPVDVSRNVALLSSGLLIYFAGGAALIVLRDVWTLGSWQTLSLGFSALQTACLAVWLRFLNVRGEERKVRPGHSWKPAEQDRLLQQLEAINAVLLRSVKQE
jgi:hypothetical protein